MSDDNRPVRDGDNIPEWSIEEPLAVGSFDVTATYKSAADQAAGLRVSGALIDEAGDILCRAEFWEPGADEPWRVLVDVSGESPYGHRTGDILAGVCEEAQREGVVLSEIRLSILSVLNAGDLT